MAPTGLSRGFEELKVHADTPQPALDRFPNPQKAPPPPVARFRNNLITLSQYYNLFFLASQDKILVYQPVNQEQCLTAARSTINLARSRPGIVGYIDPMVPHAINQLITSDLGTEEMILAVCDDGDVLAYSTRLIHIEIKERLSDPPGDPGFVSEVRPFFIQNVGLSAWGITVHKEARMIAVSSNTKAVKVFIFALIDLEGETPDDEEDGSDITTLLNNQDWVRPTGSGPLDANDRSQNLELNLASHWTNIPNIAFYNSEGISGGDIFLVSTDIDGRTLIWNVWQRAVVKEVVQAFDTTRGWGVACIDPYFCRKAGTSVDLFGIDVNEPVIDAMKDPILDITSAARFVPESHADHFDLRHLAKSSQEGTISNDSDAMEVDETYDLGLNEEAEDSSDEFMSAAVAQEGEELESETIYNPYIDQQLVENNTIASANSVQLGSPEASPEPAPILSHPPPHSWYEFPNLHAGLTPERSKHLPPRRKAKPTIFPFYLLHSTTSDIRLLHCMQPSTSSQPMQFSAKEVVCRQPLRQNVRRQDHALLRLQRLNMILQVPELSLVVVGDQSGRVALMTITRCLAKSIGNQGNLADLRFDRLLSLAKNRRNKGEQVGFRFERFLPLMSQEDDKQRPRTELLGVAVGPVASQLLKRGDGLSANDFEHNRSPKAWRVLEGSRRYRVILYYRDHTILSYEIRRPVKRGADLIIV
ncbi:MAG: hypothetical protein Q9170_002017 [Blastenia crenularia]